MKLAPYLIAVPLLAQSTANLYSVEKWRALGEQCASEIKQRSKPIANSEIDEYVRGTAARLVGKVNRTSFDYRFDVISDDACSEPLPVPGGHIFIPVRGFTAVQNEDEFAGMLAHSIGHVALRHATARSNAGSVPVVFVGGWCGMHSDSHRPETLIPLGLLEVQRTNELEADRFGAELAARAGYDAGAYLRYIQRAQPADFKMSPLPAREVRFTRLRETIASLPSSTRSPAGDEFRRIQEAVQSTIVRPQPRRVPTLRR